MKKYILLIISVLSLSFTFAQQVSVNVSVAPPYTPYLLDYLFSTGKITLQVKNNTRQILQIKLLGSITGDNGLWVKTKPNFQPTKPIILNPNEIKIFKNWQELQGFFDGNNVEYSEINPEVIARNGFPEGTYNICLRALDFTTNTVLSFEEPLGCSNPISIRYVEPPVIIFPKDEDIVNIGNRQPIMFNWSNIIGLTKGISFSFKLVELPNDEVSPNAYVEAVSIPIYEQKNIRSTTLIYGNNMPILKLNTKYAVRITAIDIDKKVSFLNDGHSFVTTFTCK
ncbi:hypothetical protein GCM10011514_17210 [Emticicia aquatilis]|uniref:SbsA Ig-like domain-containing protein n=1 Tax=Emticicia aquatilis TaxID=1537369 RepID=A0A916YNT9_9BACT|nr:hypothetical protein [Emticicia aquatilis]GGD53629.1 hypothetical protein GCM10011514_17210 [Emticicia aquatilis]